MTFVRLALSSVLRARVRASCRWVLVVATLATSSAYATTYSVASVSADYIDASNHTHINGWASGFGCPDTAGDDSLSEQIDIGFSFRLGRHAYRQLRINSNGRLQFDNTRCYYGTQSVGPPRTYPDALPSAVLDQTISGYVVDLDVSAGGSIRYATLGSAPNRVFVATWSDVPQWSAVGTRYNFQMQLRENGEFLLLYGVSVDTISGASSAIGPGQLGYQLGPQDYYAQRGVPSTGTALLFQTATTAAALRVNYANSGIYCLDQQVTISAVDASGATVDSYAGTLNLTTSSGRGDWLITSGGGTLGNGPADDGAATYVWPNGASSVVLRLRYRAGPAVVTANAADTSITAMRDDGSQGGITFAPDGFSLTSAPVALPHRGAMPVFASPLTAGAAVPMYITAYGQLPGDASCGVITTYGGARSLRFWAHYLNPSAGTIAASIDGQTIAMSEARAAAQRVTFVGGRASVLLKYKDAGRIRFGVKDSSTGSPRVTNGIRGSSSGVVFRPADLQITSVATAAGVAARAGTSVNRARFVAAGAPFRVQVTPRDAEGAVTPNFGREMPAETLRIVAASLVQPTSGRNGTLNNGSIGNSTSFTRTSNGAFTGDSFHWDEVGTIRLRASVADGDYLGTGALNGTLSADVGRFYPDTLQFVGTAVVTPACGTFSYMDQNQIRTQFLLEARNVQGTRTQNFDAGLLGAATTGAPRLVAENANAGVDMSARVANFGAVWSAGRATVDDADVAFSRATSVDGPFASLTLGVRQSGDRDNLRIAGANMNAATTGNCAASNAGCNALALATIGVYYGRVALRSGIAAETVALDMVVAAQRWNGSAFVASRADGCTAFSSLSSSFSNFTGNLSSGETRAINPLTAALLQGGSSTLGSHLRLSPPGAGNDGTVRVRLGTVDWLRFDWDASGVPSDPSAVATFGHYRGHDHIVFRREIR